MQIEKGIPIPERKRGRKPKYPFGEMDIGDSVFFEVAICGGMSQEQVAAHAYGKTSGKKFRTAKVNDGDRYGVRIWRVE